MPSDHQRSAPRAIVYARYSSDHQRDASIEDQVRESRAFIERQGWDYQHAYIDRALSGASTVRPGYQLMLEGAREHRYNVAVAEALDRFSRDQEDIAHIYKRLHFRGVRIVTLAEGEITDLHVGLKGTMNALYLKDLADKTRRGLRGRVEAGSSGGGISYGYDIVRKVGPDGMPVRGLRRIKSSEAEVVRRIFETYDAGRSARRIAHDLNAQGIPAPSGRSWGASTISGNAARGTGILNNELYVGRMVWNKLSYIKDPDTGRRVSRLNDPAQWVVKEVPELRIIDQELWEGSRRARRQCAAIPVPMSGHARATGAGRATCSRGCSCVGPAAAATPRSAPTCSAALRRATRAPPSARTSGTSGATGSRRRFSRPCGTTSSTPSCSGSSAPNTCARSIGCTAMRTPGGTGCVRS